MFPEELPRLPSNREIEFEIELLPGTTPISKAPNRLAPAESKELKQQMQELLDRKPFAVWSSDVICEEKGVFEEKVS